MICWVTRFHALVLGLFVMCGACQTHPLNEDSKVPQTVLCDSDSECNGLKGEFCAFGECITARCLGGNVPLAEVKPTRLDFGRVNLNSGIGKVVNLKNVGSCELTIYGASMSQLSDRAFNCDPCDVASYPRRVAPGASLQIVVGYDPVSVGEVRGTLQVSTDDESVGQSGLVEIPVVGTHEGVAVLTTDPRELNFGYVAYEGNFTTPSRKTIRVFNAGVGTAALTVSNLTVNGGPFEVLRTTGLPTPTAPRILPVYKRDDPSTYVDVVVEYAPLGFQTSERMLTVVGEVDGVTQTLDVKLTGSSVGPPKIAITPSSIQFRNVRGGALEVTDVVCRTVTIANTGSSDLLLSDIKVLGDVSQFMLRPFDLLPIHIGERSRVDVCFQPVAGTDPSNLENPTRTLTALLAVSSNDPEARIATVGLDGLARQNRSDDYLRLDLSFSNSDSSWAAGDFRDVDLEVVGPVTTCGKPQAHYQPSPGGNFSLVGINDSCADWSTTPGFGRAKWSSVGAYEEPERIMIYGMGPESGQGLYEVYAHYVDDCSQVATGMLASVVGLGIDVLLGAVAAGTGVIVPLDTKGVRDLIQGNCWDHSSVTANVSVRINGIEVASPSVSLGSTGDSRRVVKLRRSNGQFTIEP